MLLKDSLFCMILMSCLAVSIWFLLILKWRPLTQWWGWNPAAHVQSEKNSLRFDTGREGWYSGKTQWTQESRACIEHAVHGRKHFSLISCKNYCFHENGDLSRRIPVWLGPMPLCGTDRIIPRGGRQVWKLLLFFTFLPKTAWNWKNLDPQGGRASLAPPLGSANECIMGNGNMRPAPCEQTDTTENITFPHIK